MSKIFPSFFKSGALLELQMNDGTKVRGTVTAFTEETISLQDVHVEGGQSDAWHVNGNTLELTSELLDAVVYVYFGFPTLQDKVPTPTPVRGNGRIKQYNGKSGLTEDKCVIFPHSFLSPDLEAVAQTAPGQLQDREVLQIAKRFKNNPVPTAYLLGVESLDQALDSIAALARDGKCALAKEFCELLAEQFPDDEDVQHFLEQLNNSLGKPTGQTIDFYQPVLTAEQAEEIQKKKMLAPLGRIYEMNQNGGIIVDVRSHQRLFFFRAQLLGELRTLRDEELVGKPVVYSISRSKNGQGFQARSIMLPMSYMKAYYMAEDMHYERNLPMNACDVLRIILLQFPDDVDIENNLSDWSRHENLWTLVTPPAYQGRQEVLRLPQTETPVLILQRSMQHTRIEAGFNNPESPTILFGTDIPNSPSKSDEESSLSAPAPREEDTLPAISEAQAVTEDEAAAPQGTEQDDMLSEMEGFNVKTIKTCEGADLPVEPNATITYRFGKGTARDIHNQEIAYEFSLDDIIDVRLAFEASQTRSQTDRYVKDRKVVCLLLEAGGFFAQNICYAATVGEMLLSAYEAYQLGLRLMAEGNARGIAELERAEGYVSNVLNRYPNHRKAISLRYAIRKVIDGERDHCYKAPEGVKPTGIISSLKTPIRIKDDRFKSRVVLNLNEIVDKGYEIQRHGDELMYAVYENERGKKIARFVHRALPEAELISLAQDWAACGEVEKAWGIVMNILDANPDSERARQMARDYESRKDGNGVSLVSEDTQQNRLIRDLVAAARQRKRQKNFTAALELYVQELENTETLPEGMTKNEAQWMERRTMCIRESIEIYSEMYNANPLDEQLRATYRKFGNKYITGPKGLTRRTRPLLSNLETIVCFYRDMNETEELRKAIEKLISFLSSPGNETEDTDNRIAQAKADLAWMYLRTQTKITEASVLTNEALKGDDIELARCCAAVLQERLPDKDKKVRKNAPVSSHHIDALATCRCRQKVLSHETQDVSLLSERFGILCGIVDLQQMEKTDPEEQKNKLYMLLARYMATLLYDKRQYAKERTLNEGFAGDCWLVQLIDKCLAKGCVWTPWTDIRLIAMLSQKATYIICNILLNLNQDLAVDLLRNAGMDIRQNNRDVGATLYVKYFNGWRGDAFHQLYLNDIRHSEALTKRKRLSDYVDFFRNLSHQLWMSKDDYFLILDLHQRLPQLITDFANDRNENSRTIIQTYKELCSSLTNWLDNTVYRQPTVYSATVIEPLLVRIMELAQSQFNAMQFCAPEPQTRVISTSRVNEDGTVFIEVEVRNKPPKAYPMRECQLQVDDTKDTTLIEKPITYSGVSEVYGSETAIYIIHLALSPSQKERSHCQLNVRFCYQHENETIETPPYTLPFSIIKWIPEKDTLPNVYDVGSVAKDDNQFFGRDSDMAEIISSIGTPSNMPHYFIYGQKRCGKSSLIYHVQKRLEGQGRYICIKMDYLQFTVTREEDIYFEMLKPIKKTIWRYNINIKDGRQPLPLFAAPSRESVTFNDFCDILEDINHSIKETPGWEDYKLVFFIDEFTSIYKWYIKGLLSNEFFSRWKALQSKGLFSAVLVGQDVLRYIVRDLVPNEWGGFTFKKLTYLHREDARRLVTEPIIKACGRDIFVGQAVERILDYSDSSTYYTKWICHELIKYMNSNHLSSVTEADVENCIRQALASISSEKGILFDPLEFSGQDKEESEFSKEQTREILRMVTTGELHNPIKGCPRNQISSDSINVDKILDELYDRDVLACENNYYKIKVKLYLIWTLIRTR